MTNFTYTRDIPDGPNNPSVDQPKMKINTNSTFDLIDVDHNSFGVNDGGYHKVIHQVPQVSDPAAIPGIGQTYVKTNVTTNDQELFFRSGAGVITKMAPVVNGSGTLPASLNLSIPHTIITGLPANCMGFADFVIILGVVPVPAQVIFFTISGTLYSYAVARSQLSPNGVIPVSVDTGANLTLDLIVFYASASAANLYKYIYWEV